MSIPTEDFYDEIRENAINKQKAKYTCKSCDANVWGKNGLNLRCNNCKIDLICQIDIF